MFRKSQQIGPYTLIRKLGVGGFGEVWLAENRAKFATTQVAVKLPLDEQIDHALIEQEAQLWAKASGHPNVLPIIEANEYDGQIVIVSEYSSDGSLAQLLKKNGGKLTVEQAVEMTIGILKGLQFLHSKEIIHRDLKPDNVLLQGDTPRLADFGISRIVKTTIHVTNASGTPPYMSPEAFKRQRTVQTDIWSIGVMLYQMLKGELPFLGSNPVEFFYSVTEEEPSLLPDNIPLDLQRIVLKALEKESDKRFQTADEMRKALDDFRLAYFHSSQQLTQPSITEEIKPTVNVEETKATEIDTNFLLPQSNKNQAIKTKKPELKSNIPQRVRPKPETSKHYLAVPAVVILLVTIIGGYWVYNAINKKPDPNTSTSDNKISKDTTAETVLIPFRKGDKFGYADVNKKLIIEAKYDDAELFREGFAKVMLNKKYGFIDNIGKEIIPLKYDLVFSYSEGLATVGLNNKYGLIDKTGKEIIPLKYDLILSYSGGFAEVELNDKWGLIDKNGKEIIPLKYDLITSCSEGLVRAILNDKWGVMDKSGKEIIPFKYNGATCFSEGVARVVLNNKYGFIDKNGKEIIPFKYDDADYYLEGLARVKLNNKYGFIDKSGREIIPLKYDFAESFSERLARVKLNNKEGFIDRNGKEIIPFKYDFVLSYSEGLARVELNNRWGFIDKSGKEITPLKYDFAESFSEGLARVRLNKKEFYIDKNGTEYYEP